MRALPAHVAPYRQTPEFDQDSIPAGLLGAHRTKPGTWGRIVVIEGALRYRILEPDRREFLLTPSRHGVIEPAILHLVEPVGNVRFRVEFCR